MLKADGSVIVHWRAVDNQSFGSSDNSSRYLWAKNNEEAKKMLKSESAELNINDKYFGLRDNAWEVRVFNCDFYNPPEKYGEIGGIIGGRLSQSFEISRSSWVPKNPLQCELFSIICQIYKLARKALLLSNR